MFELLDPASYAVLLFFDVRGSRSTGLAFIMFFNIRLLREGVFKDLLQKKRYVSPLKSGTFQS